MNETVTKLWEQAAQRDDLWEQARYERFAELLIKNCIEINKQELAFNAFEKLLNRYNEHFGVKE